MKRVLPAVGLAVVLLLVGAAALHAVSMSNGAPQLNCYVCHVGSKNRPVKFVVEGLPPDNKYEPGKLYKITIKITEGPKCNPSVACGGFAVAVSAGKLVVLDDKNTFISKSPTGQVFITHTKAGSKKREWTFGWKAPTTPTKVTMEISVLAANGDGSFNGDAYGHKTITLTPATGGATTKTATKKVITTTTVETKTETVTTTVTVGTQKTHNAGLAVGVAIVIFLVVVGGYLLYARK